MKHACVFAVAVLIAAPVHGQEPTVGVAMQGGFTVQTRVPLEAKTLKGAPYSAEVANDHTQALADGNRIVQHSTGRVYRDSEGRVRREEDRASGGPSISIVDPVAGVSYSLDPESRVAWKTPSRAGLTIMNKLDAAKIDATKLQLEKVQAELKARMAEAGSGAGGTVTEFRTEAGAKEKAEMVTIEANGGIVSFKRTGGGSQQRNEETLPARTIEGVRAEGHRTTTTIAAGAVGNEWAITITSEEWTSPELQLLVLTERKDPRNGDSTYRLTNIVRTEPSASLFQVPSDYTIRETGIKKFEYMRPEQ